MMSRRGSIEALAKQGGDKVYTDESDLKAPTNPERVYKSVVLRAMKSDDWAVQFQALDSLRALAKFNPDVVASNHSHLHSVILQLAVLVKSLRSTVSRNAMTCFGELFRGLGRGMDTEVETAIKSLVPKAADVNAFLSGQAEKALFQLVTHASDSRVVSGFISQANHRSAQIRAKVASWLDFAVGHMGARVASSRELPRIITVGMQFLEGNKEGARRAARRLFVRLHRAGAVDVKNLERSLSKRQASAVADAISRGVPEAELSLAAPPSTLRGDAGSVQSSPGGRFRPHGPPSGRSTGSPGRFFSSKTRSATSEGGSPAAPAPRATSRRRGVSSATRAFAPPSPQVSAFTDSLKDVRKKLNSSDWRSRSSGLEELVALCEKDPTSALSQVLTIVDEMVKRLQDGNTKVSTSALQHTQRIVAVLKDQVEPAVPRLVPALTNLLGSNRSNSVTASALLDTLAFQVSSPSSLLVAYIGVVQHHSNIRVRAAVLEKVSGMVPVLHAKQPSLLIKHVLPMCFSMLGEVMPAMRQANGSTLSSVCRLLGKPAVRDAAAHLDDSNRSKLDGILARSR